MARVKFALPNETHVFNCELEIRVSDLNYGAHLGNDRVLTLCHEARIKWLAHHNLKEVNSDGTGLIMADAMIMFQGEGFLGDTLSIDVYCSEVTDRSFEVYYQLTRRSDQKQIARAKSALLFFNYEERKLMKASEQLLGLIQKPWNV